MIRTSFATILFSTRILYIFISRNILLFSYITSLSYFTLHILRSYILFFMYPLFLSLSYQLSSASSHNFSSLSLPFLIIFLVSFSFIEIFSTYFFLLCVIVFLLSFLSFFLRFLLFLFLLFYFFYCFFSFIFEILYRTSCIFNFSLSNIFSIFSLSSLFSLLFLFFKFFYFRLSRYFRFDFSSTILIYVKKLEKKNISILKVIKR